MSRENHGIQPIYDENSLILILGSFPSVKSRESCFFYGHPQNRFWKVLAGITNEPVPDSIEAKKTLLLKHHIAVWDVIESCNIEGSSDSSIKNVIPNDLSIILKAASIRRIYTNGGTSDRLYQKYCQNATGMTATMLPSTSPANAACSLERLVENWRQISDYI